MSKFIKNSIMVVIGNAVLAFGISVFAVPSNLIIGGASGIGLIVTHYVPISYASVVFIFNMLMLVLGLVVMGKKFALGTIVSSFVFPFFLSFFSNLTYFQNITNDLLLSAIYSGLLIGLGVGIVLRIGYSTGGMDIPPIIINKKTGISIAVAMNVLDTIILIGQFPFTNMEGILYGILTVLISTIVLDKIIVLGESNLELFIISSKHEEIAEVIFNEIGRGCTYINVTTGYFHNDQKAVMSVISKRQYAKMNEVILDIDPTAFIISSEIHSVKGRGFTLPNIEMTRDHI